MVYIEVSTLKFNFSQNTTVLLLPIVNNLLVVIQSYLNSNLNYLQNECQMTGIASMSTRLCRQPSV